MIHYMTGSIFDSDCEYLVNPVNCVGVMGAGLAKEFKERYPEMFARYLAACAERAVLFGFPFVDWKNKVVCFPTKHHWGEPSMLYGIERGLVALPKLCNFYRVQSIALPQLGCGLGGLDWADVQPVIEKRLKFLSEEIRVEVWNYE